MTYEVTLIPGDGIGPEITAQTVRVLEATGLTFSWDEELAGMAAVEATGTPLPDATVESIRKNHLALKGPLTTPVGTGFRSVNVWLRKAFELFANVRPARTIVPGGRFENVDIVLVRENLEGLYIGVEHFVQIGDDPRAVAESMAIVTRAGCERIVRYAFEYALRQKRKKVTIVHKANILKMVSGLFLEVGRAVAKEYEGRVESNDMIVDNTAMQLVMRPEQFDVMVTTNMFGDILSDEVSGLVGGWGWRREPTSAPGRRSSRPCTERAGHRGEGNRQSFGPDARRGDDARPPRRARPGPSHPRGRGRYDRARQGAHARPRRHRLHGGIRACGCPAGCPRSPAPNVNGGWRLPGGACPECRGDRHRRATAWLHRISSRRGR
jgi:isocitrate dehydrogenase (NAD+)